MRVVFRALVIVSIVFLVRLVFSCCDCEEQVVEYQFDHLYIENINNAGWNAEATEYDVMIDAAVAFRMTVVDSSFLLHLQADRWRPSLNAAYAMEKCICPWHFFLKSDISKLSIKTLRDISPDITAGSDITQDFVWQTGWNHMYHVVDSLIPRLNESYYSDWYPEKVIDFFFKEVVQNDSLQLIFELQYQNGDVISDTTHLIAIRESGEGARL